MAVNQDQIESLGLPTRPTKTSDSRSKNFGFDYSCEVDAIRPDLLRQMVRDCISGHIDAEQIETVQEIEQEEKQLLEQIRGRLQD